MINFIAILSLIFLQALIAAVSYTHLDVYKRQELVRLNHKQAYIYELEAMKDRLYRYQSIKEGRAMPKRCGLCDYCRATKKITGIKPYYELNPEYRTEREEDYALREAEAVAET